MKTLRAMIVRFAGLFRRKRHEAEMNDELRAHVDALIERNVVAGMTHELARVAALRAFGGVEQIKERSRDERRSMWGDQLYQDVRHAARQLRKRPGLSAVIVLTLALGIGANTAVFSLVNAVLLRLLPVKNPHELVLFAWTADEHAGPAGIGGSTSKDPVTGLLTSTSFSGHTYHHFRGRTDLFASAFAFAPVRGELIAIDATSETMPLAQVASGNYHAALGVTAAAGRLLTEADDEPAAIPVVVISHRYWQTRFGGDIACLGRAIRMRDTVFTIVGVTAPGFNGTMQVGDVVDLTFPLAFNNQVRGENRDLADRGNWWLRIMARLKPDVTAEQARAGIEGLFQETVRGGLAAPRSIAGRSAVTQALPQLRIESGAQGLAESRRRYAESLRLAFCLVVGVLLVACANIANLLLARGAARRREIAVRFALGAGRGRIVRQLLVESLLLALLGGGAGAALAVWGRDALLALQLLGPAQLELDAGIDARVFAFTAIVALATGVGCALAPALRATRMDLVAEFQGGPRSLGAGARSSLAGHLMIGQVALSVVLLIGAGLLVRTLKNLRQVDLGFERRNVVLFTVGAMEAGHDAKSAVASYERIAARLRAQPGVRHVALSVRAPMEDASWQTAIAAPEYRPRREGDDIVKLNRVSAEFFATFEIPLLRGRTFTERENHENGPLVAIINETLAREIFGDVDAIGRTVRWYGSNRRDVEIVGVVRDAHYNSVRAAPPRTMFVPFGQAPGADAANFAVRVPGDLSSIPAWRALVSEIDPRLEIRDVRTQEEQIERLFAQERMLVRLAGFFACLALGLAGIGLYGLVSYAVLQRTGEIGLRMALGALPTNVLRLILAESMRLVTWGIIFGLASALAATRFIKHLLFGLSPTDAMTYLMVTLLLITAALAAALLPARRAMKIEPMVALRAE